jgi:hypothetical protein
MNAETVASQDAEEKKAGRTMNLSIAVKANAEDLVTASAATGTEAAGMADLDEVLARGEDVCSMPAM